jgi:hypothetical protein
MCAQKRMFSLHVVDSDAFLEMPASSQNLYFHLCMRADDDGFVSNPKKIMKVVNCSEDDIKILFSKRFILGFDNGIIVIKHWRIHNYIAKDRYKETMYLDEKKKLSIKDNGSYTDCIQIVDNMSTQISIDKDRLDKSNIEKDNIIYECEYFYVLSKKHNEYKELYNDIDLIKEYKKMKIWLDDNPAKRKTQKGYPRFISSWLSRVKPSETKKDTPNFNYEPIEVDPL